MKLRSLLFALLTFFTFASFAQVNIIPIPNEVVTQPGTFVLPQSVRLSVNHSGSEYAVKFLAQRLRNSGFNVVIPNGADAKSEIRLVIEKRPEIKPEGYILQADASGVQITASSNSGIFYGMQSLLQLMPPHIFSDSAVANYEVHIPYVTIKDAPKVSWRGMMFDVTRHYFTLDEIRHFIDDMVKYKFNMLHLHLADDEGWRMEIKSLPKLTSVGAWRPNKTGPFGYMTKPTAEDKKDYGGFYTQEQLKDLVAYAKERFVEIMPEIDVPGHSMAFIAAYPELSCTPGAEKYTVRAGEQIMDWSKGAPPIALVDNTLCPANEKVYSYLDKVFGEIAQVFPFPYIHAGGDEAPFNFWESSPQIKALMKKEKLTTMPQVQAYFTKKVEKIIQSKGKKMMGWDEILEGGINSSTAIMSWRGAKPGVEASTHKHYVVMAPSENAYLDLMQGDPALDPKVYANVKLRKSYDLDPLPAGADPAYILGGQANLWTEQIYNYRQVQYMLWPRAFAVSESLWSQNSRKNWSDFIRRVEWQFKNFDASETKYSPAMYEPLITVKGDAKNIQISAASELDGITYHYSFDNSSPDYFYPKYTGTLTMPVDATLFRIMGYKGKQPVGRLMTISREELVKRIKK